MIQDFKIQISINRTWPGEKLGLPPVEKRWARYNGNFVGEPHTLASLLDQISRGHSFTAVLGGCPGRCCGAWCSIPEHKGKPNHCGRPNGYRNNRHFQSAQFIALDFDTCDERSSIDFLSQQRLIRQHCSFLYTTISHTSDHPKARSVWVTDSPFTEPDLYRRAKRAVMGKLPWGDASVHDPCRMFYGSHPAQGQAMFLGNILPMSVVNDLTEQHRAELGAEQPRRILPKLSKWQVFGTTPAERYVNTAIQEEVAWLASQVEGTGERHKGLLVASMKVASLSLSEWLPTAVREGIDAHALLMPAAEANGYVAKYGELPAQQTIADGITYARPRLRPDTRNSSKAMLRWSGGQWVKAVRA